MGFSRQEYWSGLSFPSPGDLPNPGIKPGSPTLKGDALTSKLPGKPLKQGERACYTIRPGFHPGLSLLGHAMPGKELSFSWENCFLLSCWGHCDSCIKKAPSQRSIPIGHYYNEGYIKIMIRSYCGQGHTRCPDCTLSVWTSAALGVLTMVHSAPARWPSLW